MSIYKREVNLLDQIDSWFAEDSTSVLSFMCHCDCGARVEFFSTTQEARQWLEKHRDHSEPLIDVRLEGIHSGAQEQRLNQATQAEAIAGSRSERSLLLEKIHKLYRLAESTTFPEEAENAQRKIRLLKEMLDLD